MKNNELTIHDWMFALDRAFSKPTFNGWSKDLASIFGTKLSREILFCAKEWEKNHYRKRLLSKRSPGNFSLIDNTTKTESQGDLTWTGCTAVNGLDTSLKGDQYHRRGKLTFAPKVPARRYECLWTTEYRPVNGFRPQPIESVCQCLYWRLLWGIE